MRGLATIAQVARHAGVGVATVSRVLNGSPAVREQTRQRVLEAIAELGYAPNPAARALSTGRTLSVGRRGAVLHPALGDRAAPRHLARPGGSGLPHGAVRRRAPRPGLGVLPDAARRARRPALHLAVPAGRRPRPLRRGRDAGGARGLPARAPAGGAHGRRRRRPHGHRAPARARPRADRLPRRLRAQLPRVHLERHAARRLSGGALRGRARGGLRSSCDEPRTGASPPRSSRASCWTVADPPTAIFAASDTQAMGVLEAADELGVECAGRPRGRRLRRHRDRPLRGPDHDRAAARGERRGRSAPPARPPSRAATVAGRQLPVRLVVRSTRQPAARIAAGKHAWTARGYVPDHTHGQRGSSCPRD